MDSNADVTTNTNGRAAYTVRIDENKFKAIFSGEVVVAARLLPLLHTVRLFLVNSPMMKPIPLAKSKLDGVAI